MSNATLSIHPTGHNNPPSDAESLEIKLLEDYERQLVTARDLYLQAKKFPEKIESQEDANAGTDLIKAIKTLAKSLETARVKEKEPYFSLSKVVDLWFGKVTKNLAEVEALVRNPVNQYLNHKMELERKSREEAARVAREEAEKRAAQATAAAAAQHAPVAEMLQQTADRLDQKATTLEKVAEAKPVELARAKGTYASASLRTRWVGEIENMAAMDLNLLKQFLNPIAVQQAINQYISGGGRELAGVKIYEKSEAVVR